MFRKLITLLVLFFKQWTEKLLNVKNKNTTNTHSREEHKQQGNSNDGQNILQSGDGKKCAEPTTRFAFTEVVYIKPYLIFKINAINTYHLPIQESDHAWAKSTSNTSCTKIKISPPINPTHIQAIPKVPAGMKNAPMVMPITIIYLMAQNPFCIGARGSFEELAPIIIAAIRLKKQTRAKQMR